VTINTQDGGRGFHVSGTGTVLRATDVNVDIANGEGIAEVHGAYAELTGINLVTGGGADSPGIMMYGSGTLIVNDSNFTTNQGAAILTQNDASDGRMVIINGGTFDTNGLVDIKSSGSNEIIFNNADTSKAGGVTTTDTDNSTTTVTINGGSGIIGDVTNSGSGALTVNIDNSSLTGDITNGGDGSLTINLDNNSYGKGGWNGGNLSLEGGSTWDFSGTHSTLDNLDNNGTLTTDLNTDSGEGGKIVITATGSGTGTIHIDTTGNGTGNPDKLINDLVVNPGPDWKWDYMDWGLEELIKSGTNADGSNHFTQQGNSVAGAVLNSSAALQQTMWFAQQNSLLKRMGELRFNHDNPVTLSGKDDKAVTTLDADSLIENLWIRSYGQQLNVGGKVSGHSYEQMVYGMDLGTDHKFTLDNHNDLYLGVYAGYGRSDVDYRVAGAEATLDSYYGGIYATWLHDSGLYVDVTFKAAGVDNELKAPYGSNQLTANYNDLNLGGSIEIGKKFTFRDDWFIEPQLQVNYLHLLAEDYQAGPMSIAAQDLDAIQFRVGSLFGRTIKLANGGAIQPYVKISGVEAISSGGAIRNGYQSIRSNIDGARAELGGGLIWQIDVANQLHLDYEASFGDKYDKPWGLTAGFRHQF
jgi:outer membrane autotransporter protein